LSPAETPAIAAPVPAAVNECDHFAASTFDIGGTWHGQENNVTMNIIRAGCKITSSFGVLPAPEHDLSGEYNNDKFDYTVSRTDDKHRIVIFYNQDVNQVDNWQQLTRRTVPEYAEHIPLILKRGSSNVFARGHFELIA
jgi:hypothetical protein